MISYEILPEHKLIAIKPKGSLEAEDFAKLTVAISQYVSVGGKLCGLLIQARAFPWWKNITAFKTHMAFVKKQHKIIQRVAIVTDSRVFAFFAKIANRILLPEIRKFPSGELHHARQWLIGGDITYRAVR